MEPCSLRGTPPYRYFQFAYWLAAGMALVLSAFSSSSMAPLLLQHMIYLAAGVSASLLLAWLFERLRRAGLAAMWVIGVTLAAAGLLGWIGRLLIGAALVVPDEAVPLDFGILLLAWAVLYAALALHVEHNMRRRAMPAGRRSWPSSATAAAYLQQLTVAQPSAATLAVAGVDYLQSRGGAVEAVVGTRRHPVHGSIRGLERRLDPRRFVRVRRGIIVNLDRVTALQPAANGEYSVQLASGQQIRSSRSYRQLLERLARGETQTGVA